MAEPARHVLRGRSLERDSFVSVDDDAPLPAGDVIVPLARLLGDPGLADDRGRGAGRRVGVRLAPADDVEALRPVLDAVALVAVEFPAFNDGRGYSHAQILRRRLGFRGEIRAVGDVARDQVPFMWRCGIDAFALRPGEEPAQAARALDELSVRYQAGVTDRPTPRTRA